MTRRSVWIFLFTVLGVAITVGLGAWQLRRAEAKQQVHDTRMSRQQLPPLVNADLACQVQGWAQQEQRLATLTGYWLHAHTVVLDNRAMAGRAGFLVLTPFQLVPAPMGAGCAGMTLLVQRGWLPRDAHDRTRIPEIPQVQGLVTLPVRLTFAPSKMLDLQSQAIVEQGVLRQNVDMKALSLEWQTSLMPGSAQQIDHETGSMAASPPPHGLLRQWWQPEADVSKHHGYAAQWFLMALTMISLYAWFQWWQPWRQAQR